MNRLVMMVLKNLHRAPAALWKLWHYAKHADKYPEAEMWQHIQYIMGRCVASGNIDLQVHGLENLQHDSGFMLYSNHQGMFDVMAIAATSPVPMGCAYKKEIANVPLLKQIYACTKSFSMDRADARQSLRVIQSITEEVKSGRNYLIFPEGTRSRNGNEMLDFHGGSFRCAVKAKCPVVPIAFIDSWKVLDQKGSAPVTVQLHYLPPIPYDAYKDMKATELAALVKERIHETVSNATNTP